jgi:hypothetical protein
VGDLLTLGAYELRVDRTDHMRVTRLTLKRKAEAPKAAE